MRTPVLLLLVLFSRLALAESIALPVKPGSLEVPLRAVYSSDSSWTIANITDEMNKVNRIYAQCNVQFNPLILTHLELPFQTDDAEIDEVAQLLVKERVRKRSEPVLVFSRLPTGELEFRNGHLSGGVAFAVISNKPKLTNLAFVFQSLLTEEYKRLHRPEHSPVAHELAHVFLDSDHVRGPNVLSRDMRQKNDQFAPYQCDMLRASPLVKR